MRTVLWGPHDPLTCKVCTNSKSLSESTGIGQSWYQRMLLECKKLHTFGVKVVSENTKKEYMHLFPLKAQQSILIKKTYFNETFELNKNSPQNYTEILNVCSLFLNHQIMYISHNDV